MQMITLITIPVDDGSVQKRRSTPKMLRIHAVMYITPIPSVAATTTRTNRRVTFTTPNMYSTRHTRTVAIVASNACATMPSYAAS